MNEVLKELEDIVVIKTHQEGLYGINYSENPYKICILSAGMTLGDIENLNKMYPIKAVNNKLIQNNVHLNKFKISLQEYNKRCKSIYYHRYNFFNIHQMYDENDEWFLIVSDCFDINNTKYIINLPHMTKNYFFNRRTFKCSCEIYRKFGNCKHRDIFIININDIKYYFVLSLLNNLNISLIQGMDILRSCYNSILLLI